LLSAERIVLENFKGTQLNHRAMCDLEPGTSGLSFTPLMEREFRDFCFSQVVSRGRFAATVAFFLAILITSVEIVSGPTAAVEIPHASPTSVLIAVAMLTLSLGTIVLVTYLPAVKSYYESVAAAGIALAGLAGIYVAQASSLNGDSYVLASVVLINLYACRFLGFRYRVGAAIGSFLVVSHFCFGLAMGVPMRELVYMTSILAAATLIGTISSYNWESTLRMTFMEQHTLNELAQRDGLTGLYNRRIFDDYIQRLWRQARREQAIVQIILIDIDQFKVYNDLYGHQAGDDCLRRVARQISGSAKRPFDFSARYGGEEFVLVLYGPPPDYARSLPEQLRREIMELAICHEGSNVAPTISVSIGVAIANPSSGRSFAGAIQAADEALYEAKQSGRNRVVFKDASQSEVETGNFRVGTRTSA
jgi:diguanylate cyclase (GGDEF)-like protein